MDRVFDAARGVVDRWSRSCHELISCLESSGDFQDKTILGDEEQRAKARNPGCGVEREDSKCGDCFSSCFHPCSCRGAVKTKRSEMMKEGVSVVK